MKGGCRRGVWASTDEALVVQLGADREEARRLHDRFQGNRKTPREFTLTARELHVIQTSFFRENFDAMALSIVTAVSEGTVS
ncbi:hypothetical protein ACFWQ6_28755 [Streptomyces coelicoflavus]|uniref:hypothetical protein n=1 Tax=Streptomyces coelicoflavus TaxID=285562 RepID=UPI003657708C